MAGFMQKGVKKILQKGPNDVVFLSALRTPITRAKKGGLRDAFDHELLAAVLSATLSQHPSLPHKLIQDINIGTVLSELGGSKAGRMAALHVGLPPTTAFSTTNRACASSLAAITSLAHAIALGSVDGGIAGGMESMTRNYGSRAIPTQLWRGLRETGVKEARDCVMSMGVTADNVAERYGVGRQEMDEFAAGSHAKAVRAQREGLFEEEIVPVTTMRRRDVEGVVEKGKRAPGVEAEDENVEWEEVIVTQDDGIRPNSSVETLSKMKPAFQPGGTATAGNSSQVSDGAAVAVMMRRSVAVSHGLGDSIIGKWAGSKVVGCLPDEMGIGPTLAIPQLLEHTGISKRDIGIWELNEAFASQAIHCIRELGLDEQKVNPKGGAIALGHPLGATGARQLATLLPELMRQGHELGVVSMCVGTGMGMASLIVRE